MKRRISISGVAIAAVGCLLLGSAAVVPYAFASDQHACSNASPNGSYGFYRTGINALGPLAALAIAIFDGNGNMSGSQSVSRGGVLSFDSPIAATVQVATDCTGKGFAPDGSEFIRIVVVDDGKGFYFFSESAGAAIYGVGRKISVDEN